MDVLIVKPSLTYRKNPICFLDVQALEYMPSTTMAQIEELVDLASVTQSHLNMWVAVRLGPGGEYLRPHKGFVLAYGLEQQDVYQRAMGRLKSGQELYLFYADESGPANGSVTMIIRHDL